MIARALAWLRGAGSWLLAALVALPTIGWIWTAYRAERALRRGAEAQCEAERKHAGKLAALVQAQAKAARDHRAELERIHAAYSADRMRLEALRASLAAASTPDEVAAAWREQFGGGHE